MKKTVFEGIVNGEVFNTVQEYNARVTELMESGDFVSASSHTFTEEYEEEVAQPEYETTTTSDVQDDPQTTEEVSFYPYMDNDDPYYLDLLVTTDSAVNAEAMVEATKTLEESWSAISTVLNDETITNDDREEYLEDVRGIIDNLKRDKEYNSEAREILNSKVKALEDELNEHVNRVNEELVRINTDKRLLEDAENIIALFTDFYQDVENHTLTSITEHTPTVKDCCCTEHESHCDCNEKCVCNCTDNEEEVVTECVEVEPQVEIRNFSDIMGAIFGRNPLRKLF